MGWNAENKSITSFQNKDCNTINIIKSYSQINNATLKTACERFCKTGEANAKS